MNIEDFCSSLQEAEIKILGQNLNCILEPRKTVSIKCFHHENKNTISEVELDQCEKSYPHITKLTKNTSQVECSDLTKCNPKVMIRLKEPFYS